jgi:glycosyltransferase involved in cell wall biosynthesis
VTAIVFYAGGRFEQELREAGVPVTALDKRSRWDLVRLLLRLTRVLRDVEPDVVHGYSGVPNILAVLLKPLFPNIKVIWGVRWSNLPLHLYGWLPPLLNRIAARLSKYADLVIANSAAGRAHAIATGYPSQSIVVIPNGIDIDAFSPSTEARARVRQEWNVAAAEILIGLIGRLDATKGHVTFLGAAALLAAERPSVRFVCVGDGPEHYRSELVRLADDLGLGPRLRWIENPPDMRGVYNALDVLCLASNTEGFPNVLGEAMACGVPCVVTAAGDAPSILARPQYTCPIRDERALATRLRALLDTPHTDVASLRREGRQRIVDRYSVSSLVRATEYAMSQVLSPTSTKSGRLATAWGVLRTRRS